MGLDLEVPDSRLHPVVNPEVRRRRGFHVDPIHYQVAFACGTSYWHDATRVDGQCTRLRDCRCGA